MSSNSETNVSPPCHDDINSIYDEKVGFMISFSTLKITLQDADEKDIIKLYIL